MVMIVSSVDSEYIVFDAESWLRDNSIDEDDWDEYRNGVFEGDSYMGRGITEVNAFKIPGTRVYSMGCNLLDYSNHDCIKRDYPDLVEGRWGQLYFVFDPEIYGGLAEMEEAADELAEIYRSIQEYPVYDEQDLSDRETQMAIDEWGMLGVGPDEIPWDEQHDKWFVEDFEYVYITKDYFAEKFPKLVESEDD